MNKNPKYFEGKLQLRNPTQEIVDYVSDEIDKRDDVWIAKRVKHRNGIDLYLSSNKFLKEIGKGLKNKFTGQLTHSSTLFTRNHLTQKEVHRGCVLFRHFNIKKGDKITFRGDKIEILSIGNDIYAKNLETNKKLHIKFEQLPQ